MILKNHDMLNMFKIYSIEEMNINQISNLGFTKVPTIILINNEGNQQQKGIFEAEDAFKWVDNIITARRRQQMLNTVENQRKLVQLSEMKKRLQDRLFEYTKNESEGVSDSYAYWKDDLAKDIENAQPKTFLPYGQDEKYFILSVPEDKKIKMKDIETKKMISSLEKTRKDQETQFKTNMEKEQIEKLIN